MKKAVYYNEFDTKAAEWLRELIAWGLIPDGVVDERSIVDVRPEDLDGYAQCHFFAGIGGWSLALRLAGWPDDREIWSGSAPCQPFSSAGKRAGTADERHLWPAFYRLIAARRPSVVVGEQVASADVIGKAGRKPDPKARQCWFDGVRADLDLAGYASGGTVLTAAGVGSPNIRQRLYWMAVATETRCAGRQDGGADCGHAGTDTGRSVEPERSLPTHRLAYAECADARLRDGGIEGEQAGHGRDRLAEHGESGAGADGVGFATGDGRDARRAEPGRSIVSTETGGDSERLGDSQQPGLEGHARNGNGSDQPGRKPAESCGFVAETGDGTRANFWSNSRLVHCRDGKARRIPAEDGLEPVLQRVVDGFPGCLDNSGAIRNAAAGFPLAPSIRGRVQLLKGYGNAINVETARAFIESVMEILG